MAKVSRGRGGFWLLLLPLLLAASGCGPGVGGTGTGEGFALDFFGARAMSVCTASFASELKCPSRIVVGPMSVDLSGGSEPVVWVDNPEDGRFTARISASDVDFLAHCENVRFQGTWGTTSKTKVEGDGNFFGYYTVPGLDLALPGTLSVESDEAGLTYVLRNAEGQVLLGPLTLQLAEREPEPPTCTPGSASPLLGSEFR